MIKKKQDDVLEIDPERLVEIEVGGSRIFIDGGDWGAIAMRTGGDFSEHALFLPDGYDYVLGVDVLGTKILVPLKKI
jgi:hypothetical protein